MLPVGQAPSGKDQKSRDGREQQEKSNHRALPFWLRGSLWTPIVEREYDSGRYFERCKLCCCATANCVHPRFDLTRLSDGEVPLIAVNKNRATFAAIIIDNRKVRLSGFGRDHAATEVTIITSGKLQRRGESQ